MAWEPCTSPVRQPLTFQLPRGYCGKEVGQPQAKYVPCTGTLWAPCRAQVHHPWGHRSLEAMPKRQRSLHISLAARRAARAQARQALPEPVAQADPCCTDPSGTHHLAQELLDRWAWGTFSAKAVQQLAHGAYKDGSTSSAIAHLAKLGSWGRNPQNCQRELQQLLHSQLHRMPEPCMIKVPLASDKNRAGVLVVEQPYLPLHRVFAHVHQNFPEQFAQMFGTGQLQAFWAEVSAQDPNFVQWAQQLEYKNMARCVPFALHGDGVPVFKHVLGGAQRQRPARHGFEQAGQSTPVRVLGPSARQNTLDATAALACTAARGHGGEPLGGRAVGSGGSILGRAPRHRLVWQALACAQHGGTGRRLSSGWPLLGLALGAERGPGAPQQGPRLGKHERKQSLRLVPGEPELHALDRLLAGCTVEANPLGESRLEGSTPTRAPSRSGVGAQHPQCPRGYPAHDQLGRGTALHRQRAVSALLPRVARFSSTGPANGVGHGAGFLFLAPRHHEN